MGVDLSFSLKPKRRLRKWTNIYISEAEIIETLVKHCVRLRKVNWWNKNWCILIFFLVHPLCIYNFLLQSKAEIDWSGLISLKELALE